MKALVVHDQQGRFIRVVTAPADAPPIHTAAGAGELVSEVELPDTFDVETPEGIEQLHKGLRRKRIEFDRRARLVPLQKRARKKADT
jgi:hypothetical protein